MKHVGTTVQQWGRLYVLSVYRNWPSTLVIQPEVDFVKVPLIIIIIIIIILLCY
jgi:hypothetical protein